MPYEPVCRRRDYYERLMRYESLRDDGMLPWDACHEIGLHDASARAYERWYRLRKGLPLRERFAPGDISFVTRAAAGTAQRELPTWRIE